MIIKPLASFTALAHFLALMSSAQASTWGEIVRLEADKPEKVSSPAEPYKHMPRWLALSNGQRVDLNDWKVVVFISSTCVYCHKYNPFVKQMAENTGISLLGYSLDGKGDNSFPYPMTPTPEVISRFFGGDIPVATPTSFLVNVHTLTTFPLLQGNQLRLMHRLDEVFMLALQEGLR